MRVLIIDDDPTYRRFIQKCLLSIADCELCGNGEEGIQKFQESLSLKNYYEIVFLDITMPKMNGQETLAQLRELERKLSIPDEFRAKVIMSTSHTDEANVGAAFGSACNGYLVKPYEQQDVIFQLRALGYNIGYKFE